MDTDFKLPLHHHPTDSKLKWPSMSSHPNFYIIPSLRTTPIYRRVFNYYGFTSQLPLLILWTIIVITILHMLSTYSSVPIDEPIKPDSPPAEAFSLSGSQTIDEVRLSGLELRQSRERTSGITGKPHPSSLSHQYLRQDLSSNGPETPTHQFGLLSTTRKSPTSDHARLGKVFILLIQRDNIRHSFLKRNSSESPFVNRLSNKFSNIFFTEQHRIPKHILTLTEVLEAHRIEYDVDTTRSGLPTRLLADQDNKIYSVIVIDNFLEYIKLNRWVRDQLDRHCRANEIGVISYMKPDDDYGFANEAHNSYESDRNHLLIQRSVSPTTTTVGTLTDQFPLVVTPMRQDCKNRSSGNCHNDYQLNEKTQFLRILKRKSNFIINGELGATLTPWLAMSSNHVTYEPITWARSGLGDVKVLSMYDQGLYDGIKRIIFGLSNEHWLNRILLLDSIEHLSSGRIISSLVRYIQIDIDDIFVGEKGIRMNKDDVEHLIVTQGRFSELIEGGFKFNLGFSGRYFKHGYLEENLGDEMLIARAHEFTWFCHFWSHAKAHLFNDTQGIQMELERNLEFAREKRLPIVGWGNYSPGSSSLRPATYAVAPHHSGVYPIHEKLYEVWRDILNVRVTSTEEYPHLKPTFARRAFVHRSIRVLPRQTCGLYTHTIFKRKYPGGFEKLIANINGGELFLTILHNPVNIYMTHMSNYANDRLAPYTFAELIKFTQTFTNLQLRYAPSRDSTVASSSDSTSIRIRYNDPMMNEIGIGQLGPADLARYYFSLFPNERDPLWTNPCEDTRHLAIWAPAKHHLCACIPSLLIVGPQKTGTTALYTFLKINPLFVSSPLSPDDFEELQFFNDKHYFQGVEWYLDKFSSENNVILDSNLNLNASVDETILFDKSATYFDDLKVPSRASSLLPNAHILILLTNPTDRAYSWYQHMRAHRDPIANLLSFDQLIQLDVEALTHKPHSSSSEPNIISQDHILSQLNSSQSLAARSLLNRCLHPGYYAKHLLNWLDHYPSRQIIIVDGHWFKTNPAAVLNRLQLLLRVSRRVDYNKYLVYDEFKGYYCQRDVRLAAKPPLSSKHHHTANHMPQPQASIKCLGSGKGRRYPPMSRSARNFLNQHYRESNRQLARLLSDIGQPLPDWLDESINNLVYTD